MKKVFAFIAGLVFAMFGIAMLGLLVSITYAALQRIFPNNPELQMWGLVLFDGAAIAWFLGFIFKSHSLVQYGAAGAGFLVGLAGTIGMAGAEVILGSAVTDNPQEIARWMNYIFIGATAAHVILLYLHHFGIPAVAVQINTGVAKGEITDHAMKEATHRLEVEKARLAQSITDDIMQDVQRELGLLPIDGTPFDRRAQPRTYPADMPTTRAVLEEVKDIHSILPYPITEPANASIWDTVKQKLEAVKQDLLRANEMLMNPITEPAPQPAKEAGEQPSPFQKSQPE